MKFLDKIKICVVAGFTVLNGLLGAMAAPFYMLVCTNIIDYITGIVASAYRGEAVDSHRGFRGIAKKVCMWLLVAIGYMLDYCLIIMGKTIGMSVEFRCFVSVAVIFWLLFNEIISILENIDDIGTPLPPFIIEITKLLKDKTDISNFE